MPSRSRLARLLQLASLIESGVGLTATQIAESYRVSLRTIRRDIKALQAAGFLVEARGQNGGYQLIGADRQSVPLSPEEGVALLLAAIPMSRFGPLTGILQQAITKVLRQIPQPHREGLSRVACACARLHGSPSMHVERQVFQNVVSAIRLGLPVRVHVRTDGSNEPSSSKVTPESLDWIGETWILTGRSSVHRKIRSFHLETIQKAEVIDSAGRKSGPHLISFRKS